MFRCLLSRDGAKAPSIFLTFRALQTLVLLGMVMILAATARAQTENPAKPAGNPHEFLILVSRNPGDPWAVSQVEGMLRYFQDQKPPVTPTVEYMDWQNNVDKQGDKRLVGYYLAKYAEKKTRVVIAQGQQAMAFLVRNHDRLFPQAQGVYCGVRSAEIEHRPWLTGVFEILDAPGAFRLAHALQPGLRRFVVIEDDAYPGREQQQSIMEACGAEAPDVRIELLNTENVQELFAEVETLPANSAVLMTRMRLAPKIMEELRARCPVPIYGLRSPLHLPGILGGSLFNGEDHGAAAARLAVRLFNGESAESIPSVTSPRNRLAVHYDQMVRFGFPPSALPVGTEVLGRPRGLLETHGRVMMIWSTVVTVLLATVFALGWILRQKRAAARALSQSLSTLNATFDSISDGVLMVDLKGKVTGANGRFLEMWGIPRNLPDNERDEALLRFVLPQLKDPEAFIAKVNSLYAHPEVCSSDTVEFKDGRVFDRDSRPQADRGKIVGRVWSFKDVTARAFAEREKNQLIEQLTQSQKMEAIGTLAGGIAHDFNNILTGIIGYAELARARLPSSHASAQDLGHLLMAGERARNLVRQILTFSRKQKTEKHVVPLKPVITEMLSLLRATVPATIQIRCDIECGSGCVIADPAQIHQVLLNLATNAVHAMRGGPGTLAVGLRTVSGTRELAAENPQLASGEWICMSVGDTGHGMDPATLRRIFEPFYTTKQAGEGTGLGLSVVHGTVTAHGGVICVGSELGKGSTFRIYFPSAEKPAQAAVAADAGDAVPQGNGEHILIVEDEATVAEIARNYLAALGYRPTVCHSPDQALDEFRTNACGFDAVFADVNMPRMSGLDLIRQLREQEPELPCVLCTGYVASASFETEARKSGVTDVLIKPYTGRELGLALRRALRAGIVE